MNTVKLPLIAQIIDRLNRQEAGVPRQMRTTLPAIPAARRAYPVQPIPREEPNDDESARD